MKISIYSIVFLVAFFCSHLSAIPAQIIFIRHGEKPKHAHEINLNNRGYIRSHALVPLFVDMPLVEGGTLPKEAQHADGVHVLPAVYGQPTALYAKAQKHAHNAVRAIMTLEPTAHKLGLEVIHYQLKDAQYDKKDPKKYEHCYMPLVNDIMNNAAYDGKIVVVCWEHNAIPTMMQAFVTMYSDSVELHDDLKNPTLFKKFDRIVRLTFKKGGVHSVDNCAQELLYGDSASSTNRSYVIKGKKMIEEKKN